MKILSITDCMVKAPTQPKTDKKLFSRVTAEKWNDDFWELERIHGNFRSFLDSGELVTGIERTGIFHLRKGTKTLRVRLPKKTIINLYHY